MKSLVSLLQTSICVNGVDITEYLEGTYLSSRPNPFIGVNELFEEVFGLRW